MGRKSSKLYRTFTRGTALWIWWPDGSGGKIRTRVKDASETGITIEAPLYEKEKWANYTYNRWRNEVTGTSEVRLSASTAVCLGDITGYFVDSQGIEWDELTAKSYLKKLERLQDYFGIYCPVTQITPDTALDFITNLRNTVVKAPATDQDYIGFYRLVFNIAVAAGFCLVNPFATIKPYKGAKPTKDAFTPAEVQLIVQAAWSETPWLAPMFIVAALTGARSSELRNLRVADACIDAPTPFLQVPDSIAKGGIGRVFGVPPSMVAMLRRHIAGRDQDDYLFLSVTGRKLPRNTFNQNSKDGKEKRPWGRVLAAAGVRTRRFYCLRQAVDTNLTSRAYIPSAEAAKFVGHTEDVSLRYYQDRPLDVTTQHMTTLCNMYGIDSDAGQADDDGKNNKNTKDIYPGAQALDMVG